MKYIISTIIVSLLMGTAAYAQSECEKDYKGTACPAETSRQQEEARNSQLDRGHDKKAPATEVKKYPTREEILSQKIAFFTQELDLSPEEAQKFWPVYNEGGKKIHAAHKQVNRTLKEINNALSAEPAASDKEIEALMEKYFSALKAEAQVQEEAYEAIAKVLPLKKAAKTFTLEEKFRVMLIKQLRR